MNCFKSLFSFNLKLFIISLLLLNTNNFAQVSNKSPIIKALEEEQQRAFEIFKQKGNPAPYFLGYQVTETTSTIVSASFGALRNSNTNRTRNLDIDIRVGDFKLDNTNGRGGSTNSQSLPIDDDIEAIKSSIWLNTDAAYKNAVDSFIRIKTEKDTTVADEYPADNFSSISPMVSLNQTVQIILKNEVWEHKLRKLFALFKKCIEFFCTIV